MDGEELQVGARGVNRMGGEASGHEGAGWISGYGVGECLGA